MLHKNKLLAKKIKERDQDISSYEGNIKYLNEKIRELEKGGSLKYSGHYGARAPEELDNNSIDPSFLDSQRVKPKPGVSSSQLYKDVQIILNLKKPIENSSVSKMRRREPDIRNSTNSFMRVDRPKSSTPTV